MVPEVTRLVEVSVNNHPHSMEDALEQAMEQVKGLKGYKALVDELVKSALQGLIHQYRHQINKKIRKETRVCYVEQVVTADSPSIRRAYQSTYMYCLGGCRLGELTGEQLDGVITAETMAADGHLFNAELAKRLRSRVGDTQRVRDVYKDEKDLRAVFIELGGLRHLRDGTREAS